MFGRSEMPLKAGSVARGIPQALAVREFKMSPVLPKEEDSQTNAEKPKEQADQNEKASAENRLKQGEKAEKLKEHVLKIQSQGKGNVKEKNDEISNRLEEFFEWKPPPPPETMGQKFSRKAKENPFVPIGSVCTLAALSYGLISFVRGDKRMQQYMMRARVLAQGGTIVAITVGLGFMLYRQENKKTEKKLEQ